MAEVTVSQFAEALKVPVDRLLAQLDEAGITIDDIAMRRPTLDDVFLALTGRMAEAAIPDDQTAGDDERGTGDRT